MSVSLSDIDRVYLNNKAMETIVKSISDPPLMLWATFVPSLDLSIGKVVWVLLKNVGKYATNSLKDLTYPGM